tara:strand:- start:625 stop:834 length:210 start_codon:yes stop_codon:yes gene_type:complete
MEMKIELNSIEKLTVTTALKSDAKRVAKLIKNSDGNINQYFAEKLVRQKDLYKKIAGWDMDLPVLLDEL